MSSEHDLILIRNKSILGPVEEREVQLSDLTHRTHENFEIQIEVA